ncbi:MAG: PAC2 family protein [Acidimicrobiia bacterium]|nr:PAC2 family protein [Acidimicrobiia bacterium]
MLEIDDWPELHEPLLVTSLRGWVDAGEAGALAATLLTDRLDDSRVFGRYDLSDLVDLQQTRPMVSLVDGATRQIAWPSVEFTAGRAHRDVVVCSGPEPSLKWPTFVGELTDVAQRLGVTQAFTLGGMPAMASHRRPISVLATATSRSLAQEVGAIRTDYTGPTGVQTVLQLSLGEAGIPAVGLWAQVPHYVAGNASPPAARALLERVGELAGVHVDLSDLDDETTSYNEKVEEGLADRPDVADFVQAIEDQSAEEVSGDEIAEEIERFLREQQ